MLVTLDLSTVAEMGCGFAVLLKQKSQSEVNHVSKTFCDWKACTVQVNTYWQTVWCTMAVEPL